MTELESELREIGVFPALTMKNPVHAAPLAHILKEEGVPAAEVTFRADGAGEVIRRMVEAEPDLLIGAGTVLTTAQVDEAIAAGARFIVTPGLDPAIVRYAQEKGMPIMPGCATPSDLAAAYALGLRTVKIFPAEPIGGISAIRAMAAPYHMMHFVPTGGIHTENLPAYLAFPPVLACGGSYLIRSAELESGDYDAVRARLRAAMLALFDFRLFHVGINAGEEAAQGVRLLSEMFGQPIRELPGAYFFGSWIEIMKAQGRGRCGHIGIETNCIERAVAYFTRRGYAFVPDGIGYDEKGNMTVAYFRDEVMGFALHLSRRG